MRTRLWIPAALLLATSSVFPHEGSGCKTLLTTADLVSSLGKDVTFQAVASGGQWRGWRLYNVSSSDQLAPFGIREGAIMTHVCGVSANDAIRTKGDICCTADATKSLEIRIHGAEGDRTFRIVRR
jgi:hypothetical protein